MSFLMGALLAFQVIAHMPLINVNLPGSCQFVMSILTYVVSFDIIPVEDFEPYKNFVAKLTYVDSWTERFEFLYY